MGSGATVAATPLTRAMPPAADSDKVFKCAVCARAFNKKANLKVHSRKHTGETPYRCSKQGCGRAFMWKSSLTFHEANYHSAKRENALKSANNSASPARGTPSKGVQKRSKASRNPSHPNGRPPPKNSASRKTSRKDQRASRASPSRLSASAAAARAVTTAAIAPPSLSAPTSVPVPAIPATAPPSIASSSSPSSSAPHSSQPLAYPRLPPAPMSEDLSLSKSDSVHSPAVRDDQPLPPYNQLRQFNGLSTPMSRSLPSHMQRPVRSPGLEYGPSLFSPPVGVTAPSIFGDSFGTSPPPPDTPHLPAPNQLFSDKRPFSAGGRPPVIPGSLQKLLYPLPKDNAGPKALFDLRVPAASPVPSVHKPPVKYNNKMPKLHIAMDLDDSDDEGASKSMGAQEAFMRSGNPFGGFAPPTRCSPLPISSPIVCPGISPMPLSPLAPFSPLPPDSPAHNAPNPIHPPVNQPSSRPNTNW